MAPKKATVITPARVPRKNGRPCETCRHPQRDEIEIALRDGGSFRTVAHRFGLVDKTTLLRHADKCMGADMVLAEALGRLQRAGLVVPEGLAGTDALAYVRRIVVAMAAKLEERVVALMAEERWVNHDDKGAETIKAEIAEFRNWCTLLRDTELKMVDQKLQARLVELDERREALMERMLLAGLEAAKVSGSLRSLAIEAAARVAESS